MNNGQSTYTDRTAVDLSLLILRVVVGVIFMAHRAQKVFGLWGGMGLAKTAEMITPYPLGYFVAIGECFGGLGIALGFLSRFSAAANIVIMIGAIIRVHWAGGFFAPKGFEYNLALIGLLVPILLCGPGRYSIGQLFLPKSSRTGRPHIVIE